MEIDGQSESPRQTAGQGVTRGFSGMPRSRGPCRLPSAVPCATLPDARRGPCVQPARACRLQPVVSGLDVTNNQRKRIRDLVRHLGGSIRDPFYNPAHEAAENVCSGVYEAIPVDLHDLVHEAVMAGYAAALADLEKGKLDDRVRERFGLLD